MTNNEFLEIMQKLLATKENRTIFLQGYFDFTKSISNQSKQDNIQPHHKICLPKYINYDKAGELWAN